MSSQPLFTVIVPAYNAAATLRETLESLSMQTFRDFEVVVVDDGSTDGTADLARSYSNVIPSLRVVSQENRGVSGARNRGLDQALGVHAAPLDADDVWHPTYLEKMARLVRGNQTYGFAYTHFRRIDSAGKVLSTPRVVAASGAAYHKAIFRNFVGCGSCIVFRVDAARHLGGYRLNKPVDEDGDMQIRLALLGDVLNVPEYLVGYRDGAWSLSKSQHLNLRERMATLRAADQVEPGVHPTVRRWVLSRIHGGMGVNALRSGPASWPKGIGLLARSLSGDPLGIGLQILAGLLLRVEASYGRTARRGWRRDFAVYRPADGVRQGFHPLLAHRMRYCESIDQARGPVPSVPRSA